MQVRFPLQSIYFLVCQLFIHSELIHQQNNETAHDVANWIKWTVWSLEIHGIGSWTTIFTFVGKSGDRRTDWKRHWRNTKPVHSCSCENTNIVLLYLWLGKFCFWCLPCMKKLNSILSFCYRNFTGKYRSYVPIFSGMVHQHFPKQHHKCRASR